jgi:hypothetical protein
MILPAGSAVSSVWSSTSQRRSRNGVRGSLSVGVFRLTQPNPKEVEEGAFFEVEQIRRRLREQPERFTPHFRVAFKRLIKDELSEWF